MEPDDRKGFRYTKQAAERGSPHAINQLGNHYYFGRGVGQNYGEAVALYLKAANAGYAYAQVNVGVAYMQGKGVGQVDLVAARKWLELAAPHSEFAREQIVKLEAQEASQLAEGGN